MVQVDPEDLVVYRSILRVVEYAHAYEFLQEISEGQGGGGDGGEVDICADQGTGELLDVSKGAYMAGRRTGVLHLQVTHP